MAKKELTYKKDPFYWKEKIATATKELMQNTSEHIKNKDYEGFFDGENQQKINSSFVDISEALGALRSWTSKQSDRLITILLEEINKIWHEYWKNTTPYRAAIQEILNLFQEYLQPIIISILGIKIEPETKEVTVPEIKQEKQGFWKRVSERAIAEIISGTFVFIFGIIIGRIL